jgi:hypothetical protein
VGWIDLELALIALAAMLSPTTLTFSILTLVLSNRPLRTGAWFYIGAFVATIAVGVLAAFVLGNHAASSTPSSPTTWVAILDVVAASLILVWTTRLLRRPRDPKRAAGMIDQIQKVTESRAIAIVAAGATLANPGGFIPLALKSISEQDPSAAEYVVDWLFFTIVSLLPLLIALVLLLVAPGWAKRLLEGVRRWLERNARTIAAVILFALAAALLRNGIAGLTS